jgi:hypothetical protein
MRSAIFSCYMIAARTKSMEPVGGERLEGETDMLRISSFKAFVISNLIHLVLSIVIGGAAASLFFALRVPIPPPARGVMPLGSPAILMACLSVILSSLIAGFVAGASLNTEPFFTAHFHPASSSLKKCMRCCIPPLSDGHHVHSALSY